jgi:hypothetical protein
MKNLLFLLVIVLSSITLIGCSGADTRSNNKPDLVIIDFNFIDTISGDTSGESGHPVRVVVKNQGNAVANVFKVAAEYTLSDGQKLPLAFTVPGQQDIWYPYSSGILRPGNTVTFDGKLVFHEALLPGNRLFVAVTADSCVGDEMMPAYCRVDESNEKNNTSRSLVINVREK